MAEGRTRVVYVPDNAGIRPFIIDEPNTLVAQAKLGMAPPTDVGVYTRGPRLFRPRHVVGKGTNGKTYRTHVCLLAADLWTGVANTWTVLDNFGATITVTATGYVGEAATIETIIA